MLRLSDNGQVEPLPALIAILTLSTGITLYMTVYTAYAPTYAERTVEDIAADRFMAEATTDGVIHLPIDEAALVARPQGYELNVSVTAATITWTVGPPRPSPADRTTRLGSIEDSPGQIRPATIVLTIWHEA